MRPFSLFAFIILSAALLNAQSKIQDIIKPVNLIAGKTDSMLISDMFYSPKYKVTFAPNQNVIVDYDKKSKVVRFTPNLNFSGLTLIDFKLGKETYSIPVRSSVQPKFKFTYKPAKKYNKLTLFGSFNGWDRSSMPMKDENNDGIFETEVALEPGRYEYKFFGDGEEIIDPNNPNKKPNGMGDYNSIFNVEEHNLGKLFLHKDKKEINPSVSSFGFYYENEKDGNAINHSNIIALLNNQRIDTSKIKILGSSFKTLLPRNKLKGKNLLRVAVTKNGRTTNIQSVFIKDGKTENDYSNWHNSIIYSLLIDRFSDGDKLLNKPIVHDSLFDKANYMGGDFQGIINKLNEGYFDSLGINTIWLSPVYDNPDKAYKEAPAPHRWYSGYHGYWPVSSYDVEERFGTMKKLKELVSTAHKYGIKILLDIVANHVHETHPLFKKKPEWFGELNLPDGRKNLRLWDEHRLTTWFEPYLPKFNYVGSQEAIKYQAKNAIWWLKQTGADGFRQDAVKHISNGFWRTLTRKVKSEIEIPRKVSVYQIGETFGSYELINSYVNNGQLSAQFNFNLYDTALPTFIDEKMSFKSLDAELKKTFLVYGENNLMGNVMDSHDKNRFMAFADGDLDVTQWSAIEEGWNNPPIVDNPSSYKKAKLYYAYMNAIPGVPVIYYGSEFGMSGASDPDNRRMMRFNEQLSKDEKQMLKDVRQIINLRKKYSALTGGDFLTLAATENIYAFIRSDFNERILVVLNKSEELVKVNLTFPANYKISETVNLLTNQKNAVAGNVLSLEMNSVGYMFIKLQ
ncbi:MAG: Glycosidase [Ignavibacteria bacterium]|nr:MAG: Glycosidase [Ignavibacteria bacterium]KAF0158915.1 MAG: Glycosidase [Ignavibacteria bacterium]